MTIDTFMTGSLAVIMGILVLAFVYWGWKFASLAYYEEKLKLEQKYKAEEPKDQK